jgi:hypothetical protein
MKFIRIREAMYMAGLKNVEALAAAKQNQDYPQYPQNAALHSNFQSLTETFMSKKKATLSPLLAQVMTLLIEHTGKSISTIELRRHGVATASQCISQLRKKGAFIERQLRPATDDAGVTHDRVAHYSLKGWL